MYILLIINSDDSDYEVMDIRRADHRSLPEDQLLLVEYIAKINHKATCHLIDQTRACPITPELLY